MKKHTRAVFLDRDGTINEEVGYLDSLERLRIFPAAFEAVRMINKAGMKVVVVTNQSGVARGFFKEEFVRTVHERIHEAFMKEGARIDRFYYCPHHPT
ncbi:MAG TPA: HAD-IIIA family hydrolase, partial [Syntrophales bacterium]|nr:HAD-IIIA family hydrolase [Syntrophales bacterium]